jgi:drug/metabolite transporter (DMT)-like permease
MLSGILLALAAAVCFECSYVLQALEVRAVPAFERPGLGVLRRLVARPRWALAIALGLAGFALQVLALRHAPVSLVQPLLASGLLVLLAFSVVILHERVGRRELAAVAAIIVGVAAIALADPARGRSTHTVLFALAAAVLAAVAASAFVLRRPSAGVMLASAIAADALSVLAAAEAARSLPDPLETLVWCALAGVAGIATLAAESAALQRRGAARVAPVVLGGQVAVPVMLAPLLLGERWSATPEGVGLLVAGLLGVVIASAVLASSPGVSRLAVGGGGGELEDTPGGERQVGDLRP